MATFNQYKRRREIAVVGIEATPGTAAATQHTIPWLTQNIESVPGRQENESAVGSNRRVNDSAIDVWHSEGPLSAKVTANLFAVLAYGMLNKVVTVDNLDGTYTHTLTRDDSVARKSLSFWQVSPAGTRLFKSLYLDNLNLSVEPGDSGGWLEMETTAKGWRHEDVAAITPTIPADTAQNEYVSRMVKLYLADDVEGLDEALNVRTRSLGFQLEETATPVHQNGVTGESDGSDGPEFDFAPQEARANAVVTYSTDEYEEGFWTNKAYACRIVAENGDEKVQITGTKVKITEGPKSDGRDDTVTQSLSFYFEDDWANDGQDVEVVVTNTLATLV